ncbi:neo-calmodulin-like isoform X1 [Acropora palmata]|uniref:neo-calmodulin-like isoform X1 n=1 Tax=Acropora palmata TaxID=6131 RepID=UPI003DA17DC1
MDKLTQEQIQDYKDAFLHFDKDSSGFITTKELGNVMRSLGENPREEDLQMMINSVDIDGNGQMDFEEFVKLMVAKNQFSFNEEEAMEAFRIFDRDDRGFIMSTELRKIFQSMEDKISDHDINEMLQDQKHQFNRKITFDDFFQLTKDGVCPKESKQKDGSTRPKYARRRQKFYIYS